MAITEEIILKVEKGVESANTVKELRQALAEARKAMNEAEIGSTEYSRALEAVNTAQNQLSNATKLGVKNTADAKESYNQLSRTMGELKQQFHAAQTEAERLELAPKIKEINDRLKEMDKSVGVFGRNVGNYAQGVVEGFTSIGGAAGSVINPIKGVTTEFQVLSKTPVIAILGLLINLFSAVIKTMKQSEEGTRALAKVFDAFKVVSDLMTKGLNLLGEAFTWVADGITTLLKKMGLLTEASENRVNIGQKEIDLEKERRRVTMENADLNNQIAKKRAEAADKLNKSGKESMALTKEAMALEEKIMQNNVNLRKQEYELIKQKNALLPSSTQELQAEADAYAALQQAETDLFNKKREYNAQLFEMNNRAKAESAAAAKDASVASFGDVEEDWVMDVEEDFYRVEAATQEHLDNMKKMQDQAAKEEQERNKKEREDKEKLENAKAAAKKNGLALAANIANSAADIVGKETALGKAMAIASTTISTYQSATEAYKAMAGIPYVGPALGAAAAAAAVASGLANVKSILSVKTDGTTTSMAGVQGSVQSYAPAVVQQVPVMRSLTGASEEARLNAIMNNTAQTAAGTNQPIKAYVVASEMQGELLYEQQTEAEASF